MKRGKKCPRFLQVPSGCLGGTWGMFPLMRWLLVPTALVCKQRRHHLHFNMEELCPSRDYPSERLKLV